MKVRAITSFVGHYGPDRNTIVASAGMEFTLPDGVDWLKAGLVEAVKAEPEKATKAPAANAARPQAGKTKTTLKAVKREAES